jgi:hypothetical protein
MKNKNKRLVISAALAVCLVLVVVTTAFADDEIPDPVVIPNADNVSYSYEIVNQADLPGAINDGTSKIVPEGFSGSKQFEGNGLYLSSVKTKTSGKETVCFSIPNYRYGWTGKIYKWVDGQWSATHSSQSSTNTENSQHKVCNPYATKGIYALIVTYSSK